MPYERLTNFVHISFTAGLPWGLMDMLDLLFDGRPPQGFAFLTFGDTDILAHLVSAAGAFQSVGEAKRNGWNKPIPAGYSHYVIGKRKIEVAILNKFDGMYDHACRYSYCRCGNGRGFPPNAQYATAHPKATTLCPFDPSSHIANSLAVPSS
jgi:hypothetical protein